ncbi:MAG TPA: PQQ-dependent sugar dehydrogenase, partial [Nitrososphaeraceae archaeon]|nr:PQQ-dependent sugar dehydrogenase [Nitrososphaeraceae archaeon]
MKYWNGLSRINYTVSTISMALSLILSLHISSNSPALAQPSISVPSLTAELVLDGLSSPTSIAFLDENNILLLEKEGSVRLISNGQLQPQPLLQLQGVESNNERGLLGVEVMDDKVFLYVTESGAQVEGIPTEGDVRNRVYSYTWDGTSLTNPQLLVDLPSGPGTNHQGGKLKLGPDNQLYVIIGEMQREGQLQNLQNGPPPDDTGVILRLNPADGSPSSGNPFSNDPANPLSKYYAYGIRNSFGIEFDPVTRQLWDAENGEDVFDEINLVERGFNSGWKQVMGPMAANSGVSESSLVNFPGSQYADPVFSWSQSIGVTDIEFFNSTAFGPSYENGIFVGDITSGSLFYFEPNADRTGISLENDPLLSDLVANNDEEISSVTFGTGFTGITDIETGPDGNLYILTFDRGADGLGSLYRILPAGEGNAPVTPPATATPPADDEQDVVDTEEQDAGNEANAGGEESEEEEEEQTENDN